jgi:hypothetical protein
VALSARWKNHIERWRSSGLSQAAYCRQQGLNANTFAGHLRDVRLHESAPSPALIPVEIQPAPVASAGMVLHHASGHRLELPATVSPRWLAELLQCLG